MDVDQPVAAAATSASGSEQPHDPTAHSGGSTVGSGNDPQAASAAASPSSNSRQGLLASVQEEDAADSGQGRNVTSSAPNHDANADADGQIDADMDQLHEEPPSSGPSSEQTQVAATLATLATSSAPMAPSPVGPNPAPLPPGYNKDQPICANCATQTTPLWRRSHDSAHILCNACALFFKMKGRPRPISLKTDVIKSRNRSKGKSVSKDRSTSKKERGESSSRGGDESRTRSGTAEPAGAVDGEDAEMSDGRAKPLAEAAASANGDEARKPRKPPPGYPMMPMPGYPGAYPYPYPYYAPYPPPSGRSTSKNRSGDQIRRAQSMDARSGSSTPGRPGMPGNPYHFPPPPPPPGYHPGQPGLDASAYSPFHPHYPYPAGYPPSPYFPPPGAQPYTPTHPGLTQAQLQPPSSIAHAQSDSRSHSPNATPAGSEGKPDSARSSPSPPRELPAVPIAPPAATHAPPYWPQANPGMPAVPYAFSPLSAAHRSGVAGGPGSLLRAASTGRASGTATPPEVAAYDPNTRTYIPHASAPNGGPAGPSSQSSSAETAHPGATKVDSAVPGMPGPASTFAFTQRDGVQRDGSVAATHQRRARGTSVSSTSNSVSDRSEDGLRSPESGPHRTLAGAAASLSSAKWTGLDERRGRSERRHLDGIDGAPDARGFDEIDELDEDQDELGQGMRRIHGVETGFGELRVRDQWAGGSPVGKVKGESSSRSRSSGQERGRSRGPPGARSTSASRGRGPLASEDRRSSSSGRYSQSAESEIARLKSKVAELTFLNGLMQSRLAQLDRPGSVPRQTVTSLTAETPRPDPLEYDEMQDAEDEQLEQFGVSAKDAETRAALLEFLKHKQQDGGVHGRH